MVRAVSVMRRDHVLDVLEREPDVGKRRPMAAPS